MKKIFEFKVFDVLQDAENVKFLDKVKKENPNLYNKFLNLIGNKGLSVAKDKYKEFEPEYVKKQQELEKIEKSRLNKLLNKQKKEEEKENILNKYKNEIDKIENYVYDLTIYDIEKYINNDKNIINYFKKLGDKKSKTKNEFNDYLKNTKKLEEFFLQKEKTKKDFFSSRIKLNSLNYTIKQLDNYDTTNSKIISIDRYLDIYDNIIYTLYINFESPYDNFWIITKYDKEEEYYDDIKKYANNLSLYEFINIDELYKKIDLLSYILSDEYYEEWKIKKNAEKYNI